MDYCVGLDMVYDCLDYPKIPKVEATYLMKVGEFWYIGHSVNLYNRAKHRKSVLLHGSCNERLVQDAFDREGKLPRYKILSYNDAEAKFFKRALKRLGRELCMNVLPGGDNVSSRPSPAVHTRISRSNKLWASTEDGRQTIKRAAAAARRKCSVPVSVNGVSYKSKRDCADALGIPRGSINHFLQKLEA